MRRLSISPLFILLLCSYILIEGSFLPLWFLLFSLWHELGHLLCIFLLGKNLRQFRGGGQGFGLAVNGLCYREELLTAAAGPAFSLLLAGAMAAAKNAVFCYANLALALFNLLPILPLDGGRILRAALALFLPLGVLQRICRIVGICFLLPLLALAFWQFLRSGYNISLLLICFYLIGLIKENGYDV